MNNEILSLINEKFNTFSNNNKYSDLEELLNLLYDNQCFNIIIALGTLYYSHYKNNNFSLLLARSNFNLQKYRDSWNYYKEVHTSRSIQEEAYRNVPYLMMELDLYVNKNFKYSLQKIVTLTMTTCKRYDLFEKTVLSLLQYLDLNLIHKWICIDDNSSESDREKMMDNFPFFDYIWKSYNDKGHAKSMNILLKKIDTPFMFHVEDDWQFFDRDDYIQKCLSILEHDKMYGQCLVNKNYAETIDDVATLGGILKHHEGIEYVEHEYIPNTDEFIAKYGYGPNCCYWPHYSLRPGLTRVEVLREVGEYNKDISHFEMDYAYRYTEKGYKTVFLNKISSIHTGRLTRDRFDESKPNAYILNDEQQFHKQTKPSPEEITSPEKEVAVETLEVTSEDSVVSKENKDNAVIVISNIYYIVINLKERKERLNNIFSQLQKQSKIQMNTFNAINGYKLVSTRQLEQLFNFNDYNYRRGMIGCALSHLHVWCSLAKGESDIYVVFEDDVIFADNLKEKVEAVINSIRIKWDLIFLGHHMYDHYKNKVTHDRFRIPKCEKWSTKESLEKSAGGTIAYIINSEGAKRLLTFIQKNGMTNGIDTMIQKSCDTLEIFYCDTMLVRSEFYSKENTIDTDIQNNFDSMRVDFEQRILNDLKYYNILRIKTLLCNDDCKQNHNTNDAMIFCFNGCNNNVLYCIEQVQVCCSPDMLNKYPILRNVGLYNLNDNGTSDFSTMNLILYEKEV